MQLRSTKKGKGSKGSSISQQQKGKSKGKGKTKSNLKGQWATWSWNQNQNQSWNQTQGDQKGQKKKEWKMKGLCQVCGKSGHEAHQCWWNTQQQRSQTQQSSQNSRQFTISQSTLRIKQFRLYSQINSEVFKTCDLHNNFNSKVRVEHQLTMGQCPQFCLTLAR